MTTQSASARQSLRNVCRHHEEAIVGQFGGAALMYPTQWGLFLALRLREKHDSDVKIKVTNPMDEHVEVPKEVHKAARAFERRKHPSTPYAKFASGTNHPKPKRLQRRHIRSKSTSRSRYQSNRREFIRKMGQDRSVDK